jgi:hypothetical protein
VPTSKPSATPSATSATTSKPWDIVFEKRKESDHP